MPLTIRHRKAIAPLLSPSFVWHSASSHSDPTKFAERQRERRERAQRRLLPTPGAYSCDR